jgi:hypothetical protein
MWTVKTAFGCGCCADRVPLVPRVGASVNPPATLADSPWGFVVPTDDVYSVVVGPGHRPRLRGSKFTATLVDAVLPRAGALDLVNTGLPGQGRRVKESGTATFDHVTYSTYVTLRSQDHRSQANVHFVMVGTKREAHVDRFESWPTLVLVARIGSSTCLDNRSVSRRSSRRMMSAPTDGTSEPALGAPVADRFLQLLQQLTSAACSLPGTSTVASCGRSAHSGVCWRSVLRPGAGRGRLRPRPVSVVA